MGPLEAAGRRATVRGAARRDGASVLRRGSNHHLNEKRLNYDWTAASPLRRGGRKAGRDVVGDADAAVVTACDTAALAARTPRPHAAPDRHGSGAYSRAL